MCLWNTDAPDNSALDISMIRLKSVLILCKVGHMDDDYRL